MSLRAYFGGRAGQIRANIGPPSLSLNISSAKKMKAQEVRADKINIELIKRMSRGYFFCLYNVARVFLLS